MPAWINLTGLRFGRLVVISIATPGTRTIWNCLCDCGSSVVVNGHCLRHGNTRSCGCIHREQLILRNTTHGHRYNKIYRVWYAMRERCGRKTDKFYADYGGRGIKVCDRWQTFENFLADMGTPAEGMQIDRINNDGNYEPSNCRWVTRTENASNKRNNKVIEYNGRTMTVSAWEKELKLKAGTIKQRLYLGWDFKRAIETKVRRTTNA